jgi:hypothetical protein
MNVWIEKFNREAKIIGENNPRAKKKFAFTQLMVVSKTISCSLYIFYLPKHVTSF